MRLGGSMSWGSFFLRSRAVRGFFGFLYFRDVSTDAKLFSQGFRSIGNRRTMNDMQQNSKHIWELTYTSRSILKATTKFLAFKLILLSMDKVRCLRSYLGRQVRAKKKSSGYFFLAPLIALILSISLSAR